LPNLNNVKKIPNLKSTTRLKVMLTYGLGSISQTIVCIPLKHMD